MATPPCLRWPRVAAALVWAVSLAPASAQTSEASRPNRYTLSDELAVGQELTAVIERRWTPLSDHQVNAYMQALGRRLAEALPAELRHPGFDYRIVVLHQSELMSTAVPGGPVLVSRATIELAPGDDALAGLLAHELSHVALRHATAQATAGEEYQLGEMNGRVVGASVTERAIGLLDRAAQFSVASYFLIYDAAHEQEADRLAAAIMERSGFDPRAVGAIFDLAAKSGAVRSGDWWAMRHPSAFRDAAPPPEAAVDCGAEDPVSEALASVQARLRALPEVDSAESEAQQAPVPFGTIGYSVEAPAGESRGVTAGDLLLMNVPANWDRMPTGNTVIFAPRGAYIALQDGATSVTHGLQIGVARSLTGTVHGDVHMLLASLGRHNRSFTWTPAFQRVKIAGRYGITTSVSHVSPATGEFESVSVSAVHLPDDSLLFVIGVAPQEEAGTYRNAFDRVLASMQTVN